MSLATRSCSEFLMLSLRVAVGALSDVKWRSVGAKGNGDEI